MDKWEKLPEAAALPAGNYEVVLIPTEKSFLAIRFDRNTGATWLFQARQWNKVKEEGVPAGKKEQPATADHAIRYVRVGNQLHFLRFNAKTGATATIQVDTYQVLAETGPVPLGDFEVTMIGTNEKWIAFRVNRASGSTWLLKDRKWFRANEPK